MGLYKAKKQTIKRILYLRNFEKIYSYRINEERQKKDSNKETFVSISLNL